METSERPSLVMRAASAATHRIRWGAPGVLLAIMTMVELRVLRLLDEPWVQMTAHAERKIMAGQALWKAHQNRLLGPALLDALSGALGVQYATAHVVALCAFVALANALAYGVYLKLTRDRTTALASAAACAALFVGLHDQRWLYIWDCIDASLFLLFTYGVFARRGVTFFAALFLVELLNREAALFMALWLVIDAVKVERKGWTLHVHDRRKLVTGAALMAFGAVWTILLRQAFWTPPADRIIAVWDAFGGDLGNHIQIVENFKRMAWSLTNPAFEPVVPVLLVALAGYFWVHRRDLNEHTGKALALLTTLLGATLMLGVVHEVRMFQVLIPFVVAFHLAFTGRLRVGETVAVPAAEKLPRGVGHAIVRLFPRRVEPRAPQPATERKGLRPSAPRLPPIEVRESRAP